MKVDDILDENLKAQLKDVKVKFGVREFSLADHLDYLGNQIPDSNNPNDKFYAADVNNMNSAIDWAIKSTFRYIDEQSYQDRIDETSSKRIAFNEAIENLRSYLADKRAHYLITSKAQRAPVTPVTTSQISARMPPPPPPKVSIPQSANVNAAQIPSGKQNEIRRGSKIATERAFLDNPGADNTLKSIKESITNQEKAASISNRLYTFASTVNGILERATNYPGRDTDIIRFKELLDDYNKIDSEIVKKIREQFKVHFEAAKVITASPSPSRQSSAAVAPPPSRSHVKKGPPALPSEANKLEVVKRSTQPLIDIIEEILKLPAFKEADSGKRHSLKQLLTITKDSLIANKDVTVNDFLNKISQIQADFGKFQTKVEKATIAIAGITIKQPKKETRDVEEAIFKDKGFNAQLNQIKNNILTGKMPEPEQTPGRKMNLGGGSR